MTEEKMEVVRNYKDSVFRMLYREKKELLSLYNAVNQTHYEKEEDLEVTTLENAIYMNVKNDVSCVLDLRMNLYEHQSTINPNMPLRDLFYIARLFEKLISGRDIYSSRRIMLPTPRFIVFYNGVDEQPETRIMRLSDSFASQSEEINLELVVTQININPGFHEELKKVCPSLQEYMLYVERVRKYSRLMPLEEAVKKAVRECIKEGILKDFLIKNQAEVVQMSIFEYDEELHNKTLREEGREEGLKTGRAEGLKTGKVIGECFSLIRMICKKMKKGKTPESIAEELEESIDTVQPIYDIAKEYAPDYDVDKIYTRLQEMN